MSKRGSRRTVRSELFPSIPVSRRAEAASFELAPLSKLLHTCQMHFAQVVEKMGTHSRGKLRREKLTVSPGKLLRGRGVQTGPGAMTLHLMFF